jgi:hypothetical protein
MALHDERLAFPRPRGHRHTNCREWVISVGPKLKVRSQGDAETDAVMDIDDLGWPIGLLSPHLASTRDEKPDLLHSSVGYSPRRLTRGQLEVRHSACCQFEKNPDV